MMEWVEGTTAPEGTLALLLVQCFEQYYRDGDIVVHLLPQKETRVGRSLGNGDWRMLSLQNHPWGEQSEVSDFLRVIRWAALPDETEEDKDEELTIAEANEEMKKRGRGETFEDEEELVIIRS